MSATRKSTPSKKGAKRPTKARSARRPAGAKASAQKATRSAKAKGATGRKVTSAQRVLRDTALVSCAQAGYSQKEMAEQFGLTDRQVRRVLTDRARMPSMLDMAPLELLEEMIGNWRRSIAVLDSMAHLYADDHPNVALGAQRASMDARDRLAQLLSFAGKLPENLQTALVERVLRQIAEDMSETMNRLARGEITAEQAHEHFETLAAQADTDRQAKALQAPV